MRVYALLLYDHLILSEQEGADLCSKVRKSRGVRGITTDEKEITIKANEESAVNLTFTGEKSEEGYSVTEPELNWTYSTDGIAKIERKTAYQWKRDESAPDNNNVL